MLRVRDVLVFSTLHVLVGCLFSALTPGFCTLLDRPETMSPCLTGFVYHLRLQTNLLGVSGVPPVFRGISVSEIRFSLHLHLCINLLEASGAPPFPSGVSRSLKLDSFLYIYLDWLSFANYTKHCPYCLKRFFFSSLPATSW